MYPQLFRSYIYVLHDTVLIHYEIFTTYMHLSATIIADVELNSLCFFTFKLEISY